MTRAPFRSARAVLRDTLNLLGRIQAAHVESPQVIGLGAEHFHAINSLLMEGNALLEDDHDTRWVVEAVLEDGSTSRDEAYLGQAAYRAYTSKEAADREVDALVSEQLVKDVAYITRAIRPL